MKIHLPESNLKGYPKISVGQRERYATATAVSFINEKLLLAASFLGKKIYLIELYDNDFKILDSIDTRHFPDLMDYKENLIITSDFPFMEPNGHVSFYDLIDNKIVYKKEIPLKRINSHGCRIIDNKNVVVTSTSNNSDRGCLFLDTETDKIIKNFNDFKYFPKDVFLTDDRILIVTSETQPGSKTIVKESILYLINRETFEKIDEFSFIGQTDSLTLVGENGFITLQAEDSLLHFTLINDKLSFIKMIDGFSFPHGISAFNNSVAVSNYGDNTVDILNISDLIY